jgi:hypothetical protein
LPCGGLGGTRPPCTPIILDIDWKTADFYDLHEIGTEEKLKKIY